MALLVTLFLVLVNIFNAITTNSPKADGLNALQVRICSTVVTMVQTKRALMNAWARGHWKKGL